MIAVTSSKIDLAPHRERLVSAFGERLQEGVALSRFTAARVGGEAEMLLTVNSQTELAEAVLFLWRSNLPFLVLGGGSNVLVSDRGVPGVVILNRARGIGFSLHSHPASVWAESGANLGVVARQAASKGAAGLEWAAGIPGTVGGAVAGNAGAQGGDMAGNLIVAEILHRNDAGLPGSWQEIKQEWPVEKMDYGYRTSVIKQLRGQVVVLAARLKLDKSADDHTVHIQARMDEYQAFRRRTQPPGASMGSMFKNPPGDYAGRLIEAAGLKGARSGGAEISTLHANFFVNHGGASASDIYNLLKLARQHVAEQFGVQLELEIELLGEWDEQNH